MMRVKEIVSDVYTSDDEDDPTFDSQVNTFIKKVQAKGDSHALIVFEKLDSEEE